MSSAGRRRSTSKQQKAIGGFLIVEKRPIGRGSFAQVYKAQHMETKQFAAIKAINRDKVNLNAKHQANLKSEISILRHLNHPHIVRMLDLQSGHKHVYLILEYCNGGDLSGYVKKNGPLPEHTARRLMLQLASGLKFLHAHNVLHRDLKPQNLLLSFDRSKGGTQQELINTASLKIADFGFATILEGGMAATLCGSPLYMAPEILRYQKYDERADLWSVGTIIYEMLVGKPPFTGRDHRELLVNIETKPVHFPAELKMTTNCKDLLRKLLCVNPKKRMTFDQFMSHPFFRRLTSDSTFLTDSNAQMDPQLDTTATTASAQEPAQQQHTVPRPQLDAEPLVVQPVVIAPPAEVKTTVEVQQQTTPATQAALQSDAARTTREEISGVSETSSASSASSAFTARKSATSSDEFVVVSPSQSETQTPPIPQKQKPVQPTAERSSASTIGIFPESPLFTAANSPPVHRLPERPLQHRIGSPDAKDWPASSNLYGSDAEILENFQAMCKRGFLVGKCADAKLKEEVRVEASIGDGKLALDVSSSSSSNSSSSSSSNANKNGRRSEAFTVKLSNTACALSLYNKASKLFYQVIRKVYQWQRQKDVNKTLSPGGLTDIDKKVTGMLEWLLDSFKDCLAKAQKLKRSLTSVLERGEEVVIPCPEQLIFDWATQMSQQAAVDEMSGISKASYKSYKHAFRLFQLLKLEAQEAKDSYDEQVLSSCMAQVSLRAEHCKQQLSRA